MMNQTVKNHNVDEMDESTMPAKHHERVRPSFHVTDTCWINDPCAPGYDARTGLYHLFYQCKCNPITLSHLDRVDNARRQSIWL